MEYFGILNVTPDSFSDGGCFIEQEKALIQARKLIDSGASFLDVGGESTRPNAIEVSKEEEWCRIKNVITVLLEKYPGKISLDSRHAEVAQKFLKLGGNILNDVSGFQDSQMIDLAVQYQPQIVVNHFPGKTVGAVHEQEISSINRVRDDLLLKKEQLLKSGVKVENIILDPGVGFGKAMDLNWELLKFSTLVPEEKVMIGYSRKRFLGKNRFDLEVNRNAAQIAIDAGARFLRSHAI